MKSKINPYLILNISSEANNNEIKKSFLSLARKYHPDKNKGNKLAERRFKQINEAYQLLSDPEKRKSLDRELVKKKAPSPPPLSTPLTKSKPSFSETLFSRPRKEKPIDLAITFFVSLEEVCRSKPLNLNYLRPLNGKKKKTAISLQLPKGLSAGTKLMFKGKGGGNGKKVFGDLYIKIDFKPHRLFKLKGRDIYLDLPLNFLDALVLKETKVPTIYGQALLKIPDKITANFLLRLKNMGLPKNQSGEKGDMFIKPVMEFPKGKEKELKKEFANLKKLSKSKVQELYKTYENQEKFFPKTTQYKSLFLNLLKERKSFKENP